MRNALTVDLEEWFCAGTISRVLPREIWDACESRVERSAERLLDIFERHRVRATFFVLGWVAERHPELLVSIARAGHEIGIHGYSHRPVTAMTPMEFEEDLARAIRSVHACLPEADVAGYRAPSFTITPATIWGLDILRRLNLRYDSSIYPFGGHPDYGMPNAPLGAYEILEGLIEVPMSCALVGRSRVPCSGGAYFRMLPYTVTRSLVRRCHRQGRPLVFYLHPWEIDPDQPRVRLSALGSLRHYTNLERTEARLEMLLDEFAFGSMSELLRVDGPHGTSSNRP
jgi:polysaccharide deacetylase family protein (PEP-CTERM system associated)